MKPLILEYAEKVSENIALPHLEYSECLNLNVLQHSNEPAINLATASLGTFTKAGQEPTDQKLKMNFAGTTFTRANLESTDVYSSPGSLKSALETQTFVGREGTDPQGTLALIAKRMSLETLTEVRETTDTR
jgi:hypothetical protein